LKNNFLFKSLKETNENIFSYIYDGILKFLPLRFHSKTSENDEKAEFHFFGFLTQEKKEMLEKSIEIPIKKIKYFEQALIHRSYLQVCPEENMSSNERMEFLGDSVLSLAVTDYLFSNYPELSEGELTVLRVKFVSKRALLEAANVLNLKDFILLSHSAEKALKNGNDSLLADAVEAIIAAIYLDSGLDVARNFIINKLVPAITKSFNSNNANFKSILLEKAQFIFHIFPIYKVIEENGPAHDKEFVIGVYINDELYGTGKGHNKKEAEQIAAQQALEKLN